LPSGRGDPGASFVQVDVHTLRPELRHDCGSSEINSRVRTEVDELHALRYVAPGSPAVVVATPVGVLDRRGRVDAARRESVGLERRRHPRVVEELIASAGVVVGPRATTSSFL